MANNWPLVTIGQLADSISDTHKFGKDHLVFLNTSDVLLGKILHNTYSEVCAWPGQAKKSIRRGDILFSEIRPANGRWAYVDIDAEDFVVSTKIMVIRSRPGKVVPRFLFHFLTSSDTTQWLQHLAESRSGTFPQITFDQVAELELAIPPLTTQVAIADFLDSIINKIALNMRMNETLEAMARAIFKSWFVDFDPVRAKAEGRDPGLPKPIADLFPDRFESSELGEIPAEWRAGRLDDVLAELVSGARPQGGAVREGVPSVGAENVIGLGHYLFSKEKFVPQQFFEELKNKGAAVRPGDVLLYKDGAQIGRKTYFDCDFPHAECAINEHVFILRAKRSEEQRFLFFWLDQTCMTHEIISLNSNSAQPGINQPAVRSLPIIIPGHEVIDAYDQLTRGLIKRLFANCNECRTLAALRDALLPKLISGELRVKDVERFVPGGRS